MTVNVSPDRMRQVAWLLTAALLVTVLELHLLPALLAGLLVFELVHVIAPVLQRWVFSANGKLVAVAFLAFGVAAATAGIIVGLFVFLRSDAGSLAALFGKMAQIIESARASMPQWIVDMLPEASSDAAADLQAATAQWLRDHAAEVRTMGKDVVLALAHVLVGLVIGALVAVRETRVTERSGPLAQALAERARRLADAFRRVVFAQGRISLVNTGFTALYLMVALPLAGVHLPFAKTLVAVTFLAGLLPLIGNLISNTVIVVISLAHSPQVALASLLFLVVIHKLEYFINARIVGGRINASAWELLTAMLLFEALFGIAGVVAAPILYAWVKDELTSAGLV